MARLSRAAMVPLALLCLVLFARADGDANISGDSQFAAEFGNFGKVPCRFGDALVPHGEWRAGSTQRCYCDDGTWGRCESLLPPAPAYPCGYMDTFGLRGARAAISERNCTCNGSNWACVDATPPLQLGSCSVNGLLVAHGATYTCEIATCTCMNGAFTQCEPVVSTNEACFAGSRRVPHGQMYEVPGRACRCSNGAFTQCTDVPQRADCYKDDVICRDGETTPIGDAVCSCDNGLLTCRQLPKDCVVQGSRIAHGSTFTDSVRTCLCQDGELTDCERFDDSCSAGGLDVQHGAIFTNGTQRCLCRDGSLINCVRLDNPCSVGGERVPHGDIFENAVRSCTCSNGILTNCIALNNNCDVGGETVPHLATFDDGVQTCVCKNGVLSDCERQDLDCAIDRTTTVAHGATFTDDSRSCTCINGELKQCVRLDEPCVINGEEIAHRETYTDDVQSCVCVNSQLKNCVRLDNECYINNEVLQHGDTWSSGSQSCTCVNGALTNCVRNDAGCVVDNVFIRHGSTWFDDTRRCVCRNGELAECEDIPRDDLPCRHMGDDIPHLVWVDTDGQRCQCINTRLTNCYDLCEAGLVEAMFIFDTSSSITEDSNARRVASIGRQNWEDMRDFTSRVVEQAPFDTVKVGYTSFSDSPKTEIRFRDPLSSDKNGLLRHLQGWYPELDGNTRLGKALSHVRPMFSNNPDVTKVILVLTDGQADDSMAPVAASLQSAGFFIYGVAVGNSIDYRQLMQLTGDRSRILWVDNFNNLDANLEFLKNAICV